MRTNLETELIMKSLKLWGLNSQIMMLAEEAGELSVAALHLLRANKNHEKAYDNFVEEIADVEFMIAEMKYCFKGLEELVEERRHEKARTLDALIFREEQTVLRNKTENQKP